MKNDFQNTLNVNLYFIKSDFKDILKKFSRKIVENKERFLINFENQSYLNEIDKYLWVSEKDSFLPHKVFDESFSELDNLVLFNGAYQKMKKFKEFKKIIISPEVKISKFEFFENFMLFTNRILTVNTLSEIKKKLIKNKIKHKIFYEYNSFKWKLVN